MLGPFNSNKMGVSSHRGSNHLQFLVQRLPGATKLRLHELSIYWYLLLDRR
jgi:hypothetical protein